MSDLDPNGLSELVLKSPAEAAAFCRWYLRKTVSDVESEFENKKAKKAFFERRELRLKAQLDEFREINFKSPATCSYKENKKIFYRIVRDKHKKSPLSADGANSRTSRFNYKNISEMLNRVVYLGEDRPCCYSELFHLEIQKENYSALIKRPAVERNSEFKIAKYWIFEFEVDVENILVLTTESTFKQLGILRSLVMNEWFDLNKIFEIPSASQILGTIVRQKGFNGILYASARNQSKSNLVLFEENTGPLKLSVRGVHVLEHSQFTA